MKKTAIVMSSEIRLKQAVSRSSNDLTMGVLKIIVLV